MVVSLTRQHHNLSRSILAGGLLAMIIRILGIALSYGANILLSRSLGVEQFGEYVVALGWALALTLPAKAGFDYSALRYLSIYLESGNLGAFRAFVRFATTMVVAISLGIEATIIAAGHHLIPVDAQTRFWAAMLILPLSLLIVYSLVLRTARRIIGAQIYEQVLRPGLIIIGVASITLVGSRLSAATAMALTSVAAFAALAAVAIELHRASRASRGHAFCYSDWRQWLMISLPMLLLGVVQELLNQIDIIFLGSYASAREAALFAASWRIANLVPFALVGLSTMAGPLMAAAYEKGAIDDLQQISKIVARASFGFAVISALGLYLLAAPLLGLFGRDFVQGSDVLAWLLLGGLANAFTGVVVYYTTLTGRERQGLVIFAFALAVSIGLNLLLIPRFGALGAAVSSSSATAAWNFIMLAYVRLTIGLDASVLALPPNRARLASATAGARQGR